MKSLALAGMIALVAGQASALSCMPPDPVRAFKFAAAADETYFVLYGTVAFDASKQPADEENTGRYPDPIPGVFRGNGLSSTGFDLPYEHDVTMQVMCAGPWCGRTKSGVPLLVFAKVLSDEVVIEVGPCSEWVFEQPKPATLDMMTQCINGGC